MDGLSHIFQLWNRLHAKESHKPIPLHAALLMPLSRTKLGLGQPRASSESSRYESIRYANIYNLATSRNLLLLLLISYHELSGV